MAEKSNLLSSKELEAKWKEYAIACIEAAAEKKGLQRDAMEKLKEGILLSVVVAGLSSDPTKVGIGIQILMMSNIPDHLKLCAIRILHQPN